MITANRRASTFRLSAAAVSMSLTGSRFSSESARPARDIIHRSVELEFPSIGFDPVEFSCGAFFMLSGYHKLFNAERHRAFANELKGLGVHAVGFNQWWVPTVEFTAGSALSSLGSSHHAGRAGLLIVILDRHRYVGTATN